MENLGKKVGYLKGLMESVDLTERGTEGKLIAAMVDLLSELSDRMEATEDLIDDLNEYVESIDDDLSALEGEDNDDFGGLNDDADEFEDDLESAEDQLHLLGGGNVDEPEEIEALAGSVCPECKGIFFVGADDPADAVYVCPRCGARVTADPLTPENAPVARPEI